MTTWQWQKEAVREYYIKHPKELGQLYCEILMNGPKALQDFMEGFMKEFYTRYTDDGK